MLKWENNAQAGLSKTPLPEGYTGELPEGTVILLRPLRPAKFWLEEVPSVLETYHPDHGRRRLVDRVFDSYEEAFEAADAALLPTTESTA
ncbi:MAG: hypothetical protein F4X66_17525 [Chloroflexi bacterium]|nr:hypothetical protein [Chloroflexota bacterium]MYE39412.1 hypothetical protein [Chloroflexota bacterium]